MDKFKCITRELVMVIGLVSFISSSIFAFSPNNAEIRKRIENLNTVIDLKVTNEVTDQVQKLVNNRRRECESILGRTSLYFPYIENAIREKNLPDELKYIAVIESSLVPYAESHKGAAGIWQFMESTAELFGLRIDKHVDERLDLIKSTDKALEYLKLLYEVYGNWTLALTAYNCGTGNLNKAIKRSGGKTNYWDIQRYLPGETQKYIPRFIAASYLMNYYYEHDLNPSEPDAVFRTCVAVKVFDKIDFKKLGKDLDIDISILKLLNPKYKKGIIPASTDGEYSLILPESNVLHFIDTYRLDQAVVMGDNFYNFDKISAADISPAALLQPLQYNSFAVRDNMKSHKFMSEIQNEMKFAYNNQRMYKLRKKECLMDVAANNNISLESLLLANNIQSEADAKPLGMVILP